MSIAPTPDGTPPGFYVVSSRKFLLLFATTLGAYQLYWFYRHWRQYRDTQGVRLSPVWRAVLYFFFVFELFELFDERSSGAVRCPNALAGFIVVTHVFGTLSGRIADRVSYGEGLELVATGLSICAAVPLYIAQRAANVASDDPDGDSNSRLTPANWTVMCVGVLVSATTIATWLDI